MWLTISTGTAYGDGVYFAQDANYSAQDRYAQKDSQGHSYIYYSKVLTGEYAVGQGGMKVPPVKGDPLNEIIHFDSTVDNTVKPSIFVIYYDSQAFPEYLVKLK